MNGLMLKLKIVLLLGIIASGCSSLLGGILGNSSFSFYAFIAWVVISIIATPASLALIAFDARNSSNRKLSVFLFLVATLPGVALLLLGVVFF